MTDGRLYSEGLSAPRTPRTWTLTHFAEGGRGGNLFPPHSATGRRRAVRPGAGGPGAVGPERAARRRLGASRRNTTGATQRQQPHPNPHPVVSRASQLSASTDGAPSQPSPKRGGTRLRRHWRGRIHSGRLGCSFPATPSRHFAEGGRGGNLFPPHRQKSLRPTSTSPLRTAYMVICARL